MVVSWHYDQTSWHNVQNTMVLSPFMVLMFKIPWYIFVSERKEERTALLPWQHHSALILKYHHTKILWYYHDIFVSLESGCFYIPRLKIYVK